MAQKNVLVCDVHLTRSHVEPARERIRVVDLGGRSLEVDVCLDCHTTAWKRLARLFGRSGNGVKKAAGGLSPRMVEVLAALPQTGAEASVEALNHVAKFKTTGQLGVYLSTAHAGGLVTRPRRGFYALTERGKLKLKEAKATVRKPVVAKKKAAAA